MSCEGKNLSGQPLSSLKLGACQATKAVNVGDKTGLPDSNKRILKLDVERYQKGDLPLYNQLNKYCSYIVLKN